MDEPTVKTYERPLYREEQDELDLINLHDMNFHVGIQLTSSTNR